MSYCHLLGWQYMSLVFHPRCINDIMLPAIAGASCLTTPVIFADVLPSDPFLSYIDTVYTDGITSGCSTNPLIYCSSEFRHPRSRWRSSSSRPCTGRATRRRPARASSPTFRARAHLRPGSRSSPPRASRAAAATGNYCPSDPGHAPADGGLPPEGASTVPLHASGLLVQSVPGRRVPEPVRQLDQAARHRGRHGRMRRRRLLSGQLRSRADRWRCSWSKTFGL